MALELYRAKRNFKITPEPKGAAQRKNQARGLQFVIQKHAASRLHYDFRLELDGVLLSWAVPKGPSLDPADKRLAMHVEDHPLEYGGFEGIIPPKQYGAGTVLLWDRGTWEPKEDAEAGYHKGKLKFELHGEKLRGGWTLVRTRGSRYGGAKGDKAWLLIKEDDEFAREGAAARVVDDEPLSVASGRSIEEIGADQDRVWHSNKSVADNVKHGAVREKKRSVDAAKVKGAREASLPAMVSAQLATLVKQAPSGETWLHEMKYDGYRILARIDEGKVLLYTRNSNDWTTKFSEVARATARLPVKQAWLDGEVVALNADGRSSFQSLQNALSDENTAQLYYYLFDVLCLDGYDLRNAALVDRKRILETLLASAPAHLRYSSHVLGSGDEFYGQACKLGLEGIVSKQASSAYRGGRGTSWVKTKCGMRQEMVIGGFTDPEGSRAAFGALLLGVYEKDGKLRYSGKVGTGFNTESLRRVYEKLKKRVQEDPPFSDPPRGAEARRAHWVKPDLVAEIAFTEWTNDGTLRHPSFQGLREDKKATDVVREQPAALAKVSTAKKNSEPVAVTQAAPRSKSTAKKDEEGQIAGITLTNPDKLLYPEAKLSKLDLALYYQAVADRLLPHLEGRPLTLVRCPNGWNKQCFYQKHIDKSVHESLERITIKDDGGSSLYMMANSPTAVIALVQMGVLELHPWGARAPRLAYPDRMIFDFDPDEDLAWKEVVEGVNLLKTLLGQVDLRGFLKTTGGKGLHVVVPIEPTLSWATFKGFSKEIADLLVRTFPDRFIAKASKVSRTGKIFIDYLRNSEGATAVAPYSTRGRANAPVAWPIAWNALASDVRFDHFNVRNVPQYLKRMKKDPWADFFKIRQTVTKAVMKKIGYRDA